MKNNTQFFSTVHPNDLLGEIEGYFLRTKGQV